MPSFHLCTKVHSILHMFVIAFMQSYATVLKVYMAGLFRVQTVPPPSQISPPKLFPQQKIIQDFFIKENVYVGLWVCITPPPPPTKGGVEATYLL